MTQIDSNKKSLKGLYAITDEQLIPENNFSHAIELALQGGVSIIQYRDKSNDQTKRLEQARCLQSLCTQYRATCIINDDIELALAINADGIHLGKSDTSLSRARQYLGKNCIIGISCYNDLELAIAAERNHADYVAFGAMFSSPTKPDASSASPELLSQAKKIIQLPVCAIGGINEKNITQVIREGADMVAMISGLFSSDNIKNTAHKLSNNFI